MVANSTNAEAIRVDYLTQEFSDFKKELRAVDEKVSSIKTDVEVIRTQTLQMLGTIEKLSREHEAHKVAVESRLSNHEERLNAIETKHSNWKSNIALIIGVVTMIGAFIVGTIQVYKNLLEIQKQERMRTSYEYRTTTGNQE